MVKIEKNAISFALKSTAQEAVPSKCGSTLNVAANIKVVVRVRPPNEKELLLNSRTVIDVVDENMLVFDPKEVERPFFYQGVQQPNRSFLKRANKELKFVFDHVCDQNASNRDVFETAIKDMILSLMEGYNCSVFVYGATGAGKTFTMIGSIKNPGITYLTMENLFYTIESFEKDRDFDIAVSYIEVYNENVYDLLKPSKTPLQLREDSKYGVMVAGLTINNIKTARELLNMLENGNKNRTQHPTDANAESSRSHAVFQVYLKMRYKTSNQSRVVKLSMIDLAGSERAAATGCVGERFKEGANINRSLLSLGNCINKLADGSKYIPYRDSKLTRLLKDSLGGNCKTVMIANISPSSLTYEDTYNTLKYAARANKIQLSFKKNVVDGDTRISQYVKMIDELKTKVKELEAKQTLCQCSSTAQQSLKTICLGKEKEVVEWRQRISEAVRIHGKLETQLLNLMSRQRVLALRHKLRTQAFARVADMAHRSSSEAMEQMCTEDIPRQERAAESYMRQAKILDQKILTYWTKWKNSKNELLALFNKALSECPSINDFIDKMQLQSKLRQVEARAELRQKLLHLENDEINAFTDYMSDMPNMLKNLYLTLKGYDKVPPSLAAEYMEIMRKAKAGKAISWVDEDKDSAIADVQFKYISSLDLENLVTNPEDNMVMMNIKGEPDISFDSIGTDEVTDEENKEVEKITTMKRKGTPINKASDTIIIEDSFVDSSIDSTRTITPAKKVKTEFINNIAADIENFANGCIDPLNLNSTFVLAGKMEDKLSTKTEFLKRGLVDKTNTMPRNITFNDRAKMVKPVVGKALPFRRPAASAPLRPAFGSSAPRDAQRSVQDQSANRSKSVYTQKSVGYKAVRARERVTAQAHPYARSTPSTRR